MPCGFLEWILTAWISSDPGGGNFIFCDITKKSAVVEAFKKIKPDYIFHLAFPWQRSIGLHDYLAVALAGTGNILDAMLENGLSSAKLFIASSASVYGSVNKQDFPNRESQPFCPVTIYGWGNAAQELLARKYFLSEGVKVVIARTFNIFGPGQSQDFVCGSLVRQIAEIERGKSRAIQVGNLASKRDFIDVRDAVKAYIELMIKGQIGQAYNVCSGMSYSVEETIKVLVGLSRAKINIENEEERRRSIDPIESLGCFKNISQDIGWRPKIIFKDTLADMLEYERKNANQNTTRVHCSV